MHDIDGLLDKVLDALIAHLPPERRRSVCETCTRPEGAHARAEFVRRAQELHAWYTNPPQ
jgi:hypothetical protein